MNQWLGTDCWELYFTVGFSDATFINKFKLNMPPKKAPAKSAQKEVTASNHLFNVLGASSNELSYERSKFFDSV